MRTLILKLKYSWRPVDDVDGKHHFCGRRTVSQKFFKELAGPAVYRWESRNGTQVYVGEAESLGKRIKLYDRDTGIQRDLKGQLRGLGARLYRLHIHSLKMRGQESADHVLSKQFGRRLIENPFLYGHRLKKDVQLLNKALEDRARKAGRRGKR